MKSSRNIRRILSRCSRTVDKQAALVALIVEKNDWKHWTSVMNIEPIEGGDEEKRRVHRRRPGHADLNGGLNNLKDLRKRCWSVPAHVRQQLELLLVL